MSDISQNRVGADGVASTPTTYQIGYLKITANSKEHQGDGDTFVYDITNQLAYFEINESLNNPNLEVILSIGDSINFAETIKLQGSEKVELYVHRKQPSGSSSSERKSFKLNLRIAEIYDYVRLKPGLVTYNIRAVSEFVYVDTFKRMKISFKGAGTELINQISKSQLLLKESDKDFSKGSKNIINGIYPNISPITAIEWILRYTFDQGTPYFYYQTLAGDGKVRLKSYKQLIEEDPYSTYKLVPFADPNIELETREGYEYERSSIRSISSEYNQGKLESISNGAYGSTLHTLDISNKKYDKTVFDYNNSSMMKLNKNKSFSSRDNSLISVIKLTDALDSKHYFVSLNDKSFNDNMLNYSSPAPIDLQKTMSHIENLQYQTHEIQIAGDFDLRVGQKIKIEIRKVLDEASGSGIDKLQSGTYLITEINHRFKEGFYQDLIIQKDSSEVDLDATK
jgi:hypothetical protein